MSKRTILLSLIFFPIIISNNCSKKDNFSPELIINKKEIIFLSSGTLLDTIIIKSNTNWYASTEENWLKITPTSGQKNSFILVEAEENPDTFERNGKIIISAKDVIPMLVNVKQVKNIFYVKSSRNILNYPAYATNDTLKIISNTNWEIINNNEWITINPLSGKGNSIININISNNPISKNRNGLLKIKGALSKDSVIIQINQESIQCRLEDEIPCFVENCTKPQIPSFNQLQSNAYLPDPFTFLNGNRVMNKEQWNCRRQEIALLTQEFELGYKPCTPYNATTGKFKDNKLTVTVTENGKTISFDCQIFYPPVGNPPYPALIGIGFCLLNRQTLFNNGVAIINVPVDEIAVQQNTSSRGKGKFYDLYCSTHSAGALMAWAWSISRLIDALEKTPEANIDTRRLGVTGCSRYGKGALIAGAFDERIILTIPQESGSGGAASWRVSDYQKDVLKQNVQTLAQIVTENCWFRANFSQFSGYTNKLPFDHHLIAGLCAPRALLIIENTSMEWLGNLSTFTNAKVARMIWKALGEEDKFGFSQYGHSDHCVYKDTQLPELEAFIKKFLVQSDNSANTNIFKTDGNFFFDSIRWVNWSIPELK